MFTIKTVKDIHPSEVYLTKVERRTLKSAYKKMKDNQLYIPDKEVANSLVMKDMISYSETKYHTLKIEGKYQLEYESSKHMSHFWTEFRAWLTLAIALGALVISIVSLIISV